MNMPFFESKKELSVAVIGAGFSGICAGIKLKQQLGIKAHIFELSPDVGGTWHANRYPGAECDIASHLYSFSFEHNPYWSKHFSSQGEINVYLQNVTKKHHLYEQIQFETEVVLAEWKEHQCKWLVQWRNVNDHQQTGSGLFDVVLSAVGGLRIPKIPEEFKSFDGPIVHTTWWDSSIDYTDKRIAVIGSGASAVQVIPELQKIAKHVYSYQRTPAWVTPRNQFYYSGLVKFIFRWVPFAMKFYRNYIFFANEVFHNYLKNYKKFGQVLKAFMSKSMSDRLISAGRPDLIPILVPEYPVGCKRITRHETYLEALTKPNATVIPSTVQEVNGRTLVDKSGNETEVDILVLATGFALQDFGNLNIYGKNKISLGDHWHKNKPKTYNSVSVNGFPNYFMLLGPSSGLGHNSIVAVIEIQANYIVQLIKHLSRKDVAALEPKVEAQEAFCANNQKGFEGTVWEQNCGSWYQRADDGEIYTLWHSTITAFWWLLRKPVFRDYIEYKPQVY